ncbi:hypothetical protein A4X13_0g1059 [Tilletia indica]|uniref:Uncharacterized protein n=1 Tax=Tilletia indica TaxID=43049 RepID=A0A177TEY3_9BASI|nr:hypothetical protein A4X13_0g1059 [Tilletia indica]
MSTQCEYVRDRLDEELDEAFTEPNDKDKRRRVWNIIEEQLVRIENLQSQVQAGEDSIRFLRATQDLTPLQEELAAMRTSNLTLEQTLRKTELDMKRSQADQDEKLATELNYADRVAALGERERINNLKATFREQITDLEQNYKDIEEMMKSIHATEMKEVAAKNADRLKEVAAKNADRQDKDDMTIKELIQNLRLAEEEAGRWRRKALGEGVNKLPEDSQTMDKTNTLTKPRWYSSPPILESLYVCSWIMMDIDSTSEKALPPPSSPVVSSSPHSNDTRSEPDSFYPDGISARAQELNERDTGVVEQTRQDRARVWVKWVTH